MSKVSNYQNQVKTAICNNGFRNLFEDVTFCQEWDAYWREFERNHGQADTKQDPKFFAGFLVGQAWEGIQARWQAEDAARAAMS